MHLTIWWFISASKEVQYIALFEPVPKTVENTTKYTHSLLLKNESAHSEFGQPATFHSTASSNVLKSPLSNFGNNAFASNLPSFKELAKKANASHTIYSYNYIKSISEISIEIDFDRPEFGQMDWEKKSV